MGQLKPNRYVSGDILLTTTNKILVTNEGPDGKFITQYSYPSGILEVEVNIGNTIPTPWGIFADSGNIYICDSSGLLYNIDVNYPYALTLFNNAGFGIGGASQIPSCITNHLNPPPTPTPTPTKNNHTNKNTNPNNYTNKNINKNTNANTNINKNTNINTNKDIYNNTNTINNTSNKLFLFSSIKCNKWYSNTNIFNGKYHFQ